MNLNLNTGSFGIWNYTIQYNDWMGFWGTPNTVLITIEDQTSPWSSDPADATHAQGTTAVLTWTLYDNGAGGTYHVLWNGSLYSSWTACTNNTLFNVALATEELGVWNYTIQYNDSVGLWGTPNTVLIIITEDGGIPGFTFLFGVVGLVAIAVNYYRKKRSSSKI